MFKAYGFILESRHADEYVLGRIIRRETRLANNTEIRKNTDYGQREL